MDDVNVSAIYSGDTVHIFNRFAEKPAGELKLVLTMEDGRVLEESVEISPISQNQEVPNNHTSLTARLAAHQRMLNITNPLSAAQIAIRYQLVSAYTHYLVLDMRHDDQKVNYLPELRKIDGMLSAGWGGIGKLGESYDVPTFCRRVMPDNDSIQNGRPSNFSKKMIDDSIFQNASEKIVILFRMIRVFNRQSSIEDTQRQLPTIPVGYVDSREFFRNLEAAHGVFVKTLQVRSLSDLSAMGVPQEIMEKLVILVETGHNEENVVMIFLYKMLKSHASISKVMSRTTRFLIVQAFKSLSSVDALMEEMIPIVKGFQ
ncbi:MAG: hypothetical protein HQL88_02520 [Magnetococcales bacterium]|nr:hypothetical protein [Magnetococcales bacterium]